MSGQRKANRADGHLGQQSAGRDLGVSTGQVLGAGGDRGVRGEARLGLTVLLLFLVVVLVVRAVGVVAVRVLTVSAAHLTAVSWRITTGLFLVSCKSESPTVAQREAFDAMLLKVWTGASSITLNFGQSLKSPLLRNSKCSF